MNRTGDASEQVESQQRELEALRRRVAELEAELDQRDQDAVRLRAADGDGGVERFRLLAENVPGVIYLCRNDERYTMLYLNQEVEALTGYPAADFLEDRRSFVDLYHPDDVDTIFNRVDAALDKRQSFYLKYRVKHRDGHWLWVQETGVGVFEDDKLCYLEGLMLDVTQQEEVQRQLRLAHDKLSWHVDNTPLAVIEWDRQWRARYWSDQAARMFGWRGDEVIGQTWGQWPFVHPDDLEHVVSTSRELTDGHKLANTCRNRNLTKDGRVLHCQWFNSVLHDERGRLVSMLSFVQDVTDLVEAEAEVRKLNTELEHRVQVRTAELAQANEKLAEEGREREQISRELRRQTRLLQLMLSHTAEGVVVADQRGQFLIWNAAATQMLQRGPDVTDVSAWSSAYRLYRPEDKTLVPTHELPLARAIRGEVVDDFELLVQPQEPNEDRHISVNARPVVDERGEIQGGVAVFRDMTARKSAEEALRLVRLAVDQVGDSVVITDALINQPGPRIQYVNPAFEKMTGYSAQEVLGQTPRILQGPQTNRKVLDQVRAALEAGAPFHGETTNYTKDNKPFQVEWHIAPVRDASGHVTHFVSIQRDITQRRAREEMERQHQAELAHVARLSTMGEMASGLAHELNQPLAAISNYIRGCLRRVASGSADPAQITDAMTRVAQQADRAGQIIQRLREFVKKSVPRREAFELNHVIRDAVELASHDMLQMGIEVQMDLAGGLPAAQGDEIQIEQVILNLLRNAMEATEPNNGDQSVVRVVSEHDARRQELRIRVIDQGVGASDEQLSQMFNPFYTTKSQGMGMGLNISQSIVEAHGGRLVASRNLDRGLTMAMSLPVVGSGPAEA